MAVLAGVVNCATLHIKVFQRCNQKILEQKVAEFMTPVLRYRGWMCLQAKPERGHLLSMKM